MKNLMLRVGLGATAALLLWLVLSGLMLNSWMVLILLFDSAMFAVAACFREEKNDELL